MAKFFILFLLFPFINNVKAQSSYIKDIDKLYSILKTTPSFKDQISGNKLIEYNHLYDSLKRDTSNILSAYDVFYNLAQLFFPLKDNHLGFYQLPSAVLSKSKFSDSVAIKAYRKSEAFRQYPKYNISTGSLESALNNKSKNSVEGIYYYSHYLKIGLFKTSANQYVGIVLATTLPNWEKGQVAIRLYQYLPNYFRAIYGHPVFKILMLYNNEKYRNQSLINSHFYASLTGAVYKKNPDAPDFVNIKNDHPQFEFKIITPAIQYIRIGNFSAAASDIKTSQQFYNRIKDSLTAPNLIVDLRNNTGGAYKASKKYWKLIKTYSKKGKVAVIINNETMSEAERFLLQLKKIPTIQAFGQSTKGTLAYGSNYGTTEKLPGGKFQVYITDMKDKGHYLQYENFGITPDIILNNNAGWIEQVVQKIKE